MATRTVMTKQIALAKARERRRELDRERAEHDRRIEEATAATLVALEVLADAQHALDAAQAEVGKSLRLILAEGASTDRAAALLNMEVSEARRLLKRVPHDASEDPRTTRRTAASSMLTGDARTGSASRS